MNATTRYLVPSGHKRLAVTTDELQALLGCGLNFHQRRIIDRNHFLIYYVATQSKIRSDSQWQRQSAQTPAVVF